MNGLGADTACIGKLLELLEQIPSYRRRCDIVVFPPATLLRSFVSAYAGSGIRFGGQDCHTARSGAHTGEISAAMLADSGATHVITGHSERRNAHHESDDLVRLKAVAATDAGLVPVICVGETASQRRDGLAKDVIQRQLAGSVPDTARAYIIAYEPVWAIGTGNVPSAGNIEEIHTVIREYAGSDIPVLYGGSVKPENAAEIIRINNVDGVLAGGASLQAETFHSLAKAVCEAEKPADTAG